MYSELILICIQVYGLIMSSYYSDYNKINSLKRYIMTLLAICIYIPITEEILFRYAFYHLLQKYLDNKLYINVINGIVFGLSHAPNILIINYPNKIIYCIHICTNTYLGYYLATIHDNLPLCMMIHIIYNLIPSTIPVIYNKMIYKPKPDNEISDNNTLYASKPRLRRCYSLTTNRSIYDDFISINKRKINKDVLQSIEKYKEKMENRRKNEI